MVYKGVSKHIEFSCDYLDVYDEFDIEVPVTESFRDVLAYLFEKKYDKPYSELSWYLEEGAKDFVKDLEDKWLHNEIDTFTLYHDRDFLDFLESRDISWTPLDNEIEDAYQDFLNECEWEARRMSKSQLKDLIDETCGTVEVEAYIDGMPQYFVQDTIDLEDIYDEEYGDDEDEEEEED